MYGEQLFQILPLTMHGKIKIEDAPRCERLLTA